MTSLLTQAVTKDSPLITHLRKYTKGHSVCRAPLLALVYYTMTFFGVAGWIQDFGNGGDPGNCKILKHGAFKHMYTTYSFLLYEFWGALPLDPPLCGLRGGFRGYNDIYLPK